MNDNFFASVGAIVLRGNEGLLVRHTYGSASGKLLNPGGYIHDGELPYDAVKLDIALNKEPLLMKDAKKGRVIFAV